MKGNLEILKEFKHARVVASEQDPTALIVTATSSYIPIDQFKIIFNEIGNYVKQGRVSKLIFDKRQLTVFHQPSMEWYFVEWKDQMFDLGLTRHVKILPNDEVFRQSVQIGRSKINKMYPHGKFHQMDIRYAESVEEALAL